MQNPSLLLLILLLASSSGAHAQDRPRPYPVFLTPQFERAVEKGTRTLTGEPGPNYWTNTAEYRIQAVLSPEGRLLQGEQTVRYHNNSPDTLRRIEVHLRQNLHAPGVVRNRTVDVTGGVQLSEVAAGGQSLVERRSFREPGFVVDGTVMIVTLPRPLAPGSFEELSFAWSFAVPARAPRMGQDGDVFYLGYWYPQIAVYDDLDGWVAEPYMGDGEFYMGYGIYEVDITVPEGWLVAATGTLQNPEDVLSAQTRERLAEASETREVVPVVTAEERSAGVSTASSPTGTLTWHFQADQVRDFAFGTSASYVWDATSARTGEGSAMIHSLYRPEMPTWNRSAHFAQFSIEFLSDYLIPYPYSQMSAVEGIIGGGMEYPMITLISGVRSERSLFSVTLHEIVHMWFPIMVGQNEKAFTWMDEGPASFYTNEGMGVFFETEPWSPFDQSYYNIAGTGMEVESMRHADQYPLGTSARGIASYSKPAVALHALRGIVGQERFQEAYRTYARRWSWKHPQPFDLFNTFEDVLGEDLSWFWRTLFYETWTLDQSIARVSSDGAGVSVTIEDLGLSPMPAPVRVTYADGSTAEQTIPVEVWLSGERERTLNFPAGEVVRVEIDAGEFLPDIDRWNNVWEP